MHAIRQFVLISMLLAGLLAFGCLPSVATSVESSNDGDAWKHLIDQRVQEQASGKNSVLDETLPTWKAYWTGWYSSLRRSTPDRLLGKGSEFRSGEDMVRYIKDRLKQHRLPTYERPNPALEPIARPGT